MPGTVHNITVEKSTTIRGFALIKGPFLSGIGGIVSPTNDPPSATITADPQSGDAVPLDITELSEAAPDSYYILTTAQQTTLTSAQVRAGNDENDAAAAVSGAFAATSGSQQIALPDELDDTFYIYVVLGDAAGAYSDPIEAGPVAINTVVGPTDIMAGVGDFSSATGWSGISTSAPFELVISGGRLVVNTVNGFRSTKRQGTNSVPCPANATLNMSFDVPVLNNKVRMRIHLKPLNSSLASLGVTTVFDTDVTADDDLLVVGTVSKDTVLTTPAGTAFMEVTLEFTSAGFDGEFDNFKLEIA